MEDVMNFGGIIGAIFLFLIATSNKRIEDQDETNGVIPLDINYIVNILPIHPTKRYDSRNLESIENITVHHSATLTGSAASYANHHVTEKDWPGIGYHFEIAKNGAVSQTNDLTTISYHAGTPFPNNNNVSIGICLTGNFDLERPTLAQEQSLIALIRELSNTVQKQLPVYGHRDFKNTSCPGLNLNTDFYQNLAYQNA